MHFELPVCDDPPAEHAPESLTWEAREAARRTAQAPVAWRAAREAWEDDRPEDALVLIADYTELYAFAAAEKMLNAVIAAREPEQRVAALAALESVAADTACPMELREFAATAASRVTEPRRRDELTVSAHFGGAWALRAGTSVGEGRTGFGVEFPVGPTWRLRGELHSTPFATTNVMLWGHRLFFGVARSWPLGSSKWALEGAAELGIWSSQGPWWKEGEALQAGGRLLGALDWRFGRNVGMALEVGTTWWPTMTLDMAGFGEPLDVSLSIKAWFGVPPQMRLLREDSVPSGA